MDDWKRQHQIDEHLKFYDFNCKQGPTEFMDCSQKFNSYAFPVVLIFDENRNIIERIDGLYPKQIIYGTLDKLNDKAKAIG